MIGERAYRNAIARAEELRKELAEIEAFLDMCRRLAESCDVVHASRGECAAASESTVAVVAHLTRHAGASPSGNLESQIRDIILARGNPMMRTQIAESLKKRGLLTDSADPANYVGTRMWRAKDQFRNVPGMGYWPSDVPLPYVQADLSDTLGVTPDDRSSVTRPSTAGAEHAD